MQLEIATKPTHILKSRRFIDIILSAHSYTCVVRLYLWVSVHRSWGASALSQTIFPFPMAPFSSLLIQWLKSWHICWHVNMMKYSESDTCQNEILDEYFPNESLSCVWNLVSWCRDSDILEDRFKVYSGFIIIDMVSFISTVILDLIIAIAIPIIIKILFLSLLS